MRKCLVTGSQGFIGQHFVRRLRELDYDPVPADDLIRSDSRASALEKLGSLKVFHFAGAVGVGESWAEPAWFIESNVLGISRVLEFCSRTGGQLIFPSSPIERSTKVPATTTKNSANPYLLSKRLAEQTCEFFEKSYGLNIVVLRLFNVYGPGQSARFLIPQLIKQLLEHDCVSVQNLSSVRDYIYIDDIIEALTSLLEKSSSFSGVFDIGTGIGTTVQSLITTLGDIHSRPYRIECDQTREPERVASSIADTSMSRSALKWEPRVSLREGLQKTYLHTTKNQKTLS